MEYTPQQVADQVGVSVQSIRAWCRKHDVSRNAKGYFLTESEYAQVVAHYLSHDESRESMLLSESAKARESSGESGAKASPSVTDVLLAQVEDLKSQIDAKDRQISSLMESLTTTQDQLSTAQGQLADAQASIKSLSASVAVHTVADNKERILIAKPSDGSKDEDDSTKIKHVSRWQRLKARLKDRG